MTRTLLIPFGLAALLAMPLLAQERKLNADEVVVRVKPASLTLAVGQTAQLKAEVVDIGGRPVDARVFFFSRARRQVQVDRSGKVTARRPGDPGARRRQGPGADRDGHQLGYPGLSVARPELDAG